MDRGRWKALAGASLSVCLLLAVSQAQDHPAAPHEHPDAQKLRNPVAATTESLAAGGSIYAKACALCHGATGSGDGRLAAATAAYGARPSDLTDDIWQHGPTDGEIFAAIRDGIGPDFSMSPWRSRLSDEEIWSVVNYLKSLSGKR